MTWFRAVLSLVVLAVLGLPALAGIDEAAEPELPIGTGRGFEALLPEQTAIFASVRDVPALLEKLKALPLGKVVLREGFFDDLLPPMVVDRTRGFYKKFVEPALAIPAGEAALVWGQPDFEGLTPEFAVLADVSGNEAALERYLEETIHPLMDTRYERKDVAIGGVTFTRVGAKRFGEEAAVLGVRDGVFVLATLSDSPEAVVEALWKPARASLATNPRFQQVERALAGADVMGYVDIGAIDHQQKKSRMARGRIASYNRTWGMARAVCGFEEFEGIGAGVSFGPGDGSTTICGFGTGAEGGIAGALTRAAPLKSVRYVDADACFYTALSLGSLSQTYSDFILTAAKCCEVIGTDPDDLWWIHETVDAIEAFLGRDLAKDVLPAFGGEVAVAAWIPGGLDVPPAALLIEVKDKEAVVDIVEDLLAAILEAGDGLIEAERKTYEGVEIVSVDGVPQVIPAVAFVGDFLVVATNASVIEDMVDTLAEGPHLGEAEGYKRYVASIPGDAAITVYIDTKRIFAFGWPMAVQMIGTPPEAARTLKAVGELGGALSPLGVKVIGSEEGVTLVSRSANGGLGPGGFLVGASSLLVVVQCNLIDLD